MAATASPLGVLDVAKALAFVGDLSMGQPVDHSLRTACIARALARASGCGPVETDTAYRIALLRWSGCTANATQFSGIFEDDVLGRARSLSTSMASLADRITPANGKLLLQAIGVHCEVSIQIAALLGASPQVREGLGLMFESFDGRHSPGSRSGRDVPMPVYVANLAGDIEVFSRENGVDEAMRRIAAQGDRRYPAALVDCAVGNIRRWLDDLADRSDFDEPGAAATPPAGVVGLELVADVIDLKIPWMTGYSRRVAAAVQACCDALAMEPASAAESVRAALIHGLGRASVPNAVWNSTGRPSLADTERMRLVPYWTQRAAAQIPALRVEAELASYAFERVNGEGFFRGRSVGKMPIEAQVLALAVAWCDARTPRPHRPGCSVDEASERLLDQAAEGGFDATLARRFTAAIRIGKPPDRRTSRPLLSERERQVLLRISLGDSTKQAALALDIGPGTVRTHVESILKKLGCTTRAAATLKAATLGLI